MNKIEQKWLNQTSTQGVFDLFEQAGHTIYAVGGCVRNSVMGRPITDIDLATSAAPNIGIELAQSADLKVIPTGVDHGTITIVVDDESFEITTFRKDVETDGRRAVVAFSDRIEDDAERRDFTMNALYVDRNGHILDPLDGLPDALAQRVRFIGNAAERIKEDSLRILRFFRFFAIYGDMKNGLDADGLASCAEFQDQMDHLSKERIGTELLKLLGAEDPAVAVSSMSQAGILGRLVAGADATALSLLVHFEQNFQFAPDALRRLSVLTESDMQKPLALSNRKSKEHQMIASAAREEKTLREVAYRCGSTVANSVALVRAALIEHPPTPETFTVIDSAACQSFPITASDLMDRYSGKALGDALKSREAKWIASEFTLTREQLLA